MMCCGLLLGYSRGSLSFACVLGQGVNESLFIKAWRQQTIFLCVYFFNWSAKPAQYELLKGTQ